MFQVEGTACVKAVTWEGAQERFVGGAEWNGVLEEVSRQEEGA